MVGFRIDELMSGHHMLGVDGKERPMSFNITWGPDDILKWLNPFSDSFLTQELSGTVTIGGLCTDVPCSGTLELLYFTKQKIRYTFTFNTLSVDRNSVSRFRFVGEKINLRPWNLHRTHTTCYGELWLNNRSISKSVTYFKLNTLLKFLSSFRFIK